MTDIATAALWCVLQVTCIGLAAAAGYLALRRRSPATATLMLLFGLTLPLLLTAAALSPWPSWLPAPTEAAIPVERPDAVVTTVEVALPPSVFDPLPASVDLPPIDLTPSPTVADPIPAEVTRVAPPATVTPIPAPRWPVIGLLAMAGVLAIGGLRFLIGWLAVLRELAQPARG